MANFFTQDPRCKALWRFESGALTADSKGTNTLTAVATPVADLADFQEGAACADLEYTDGDYFTILDASLDAGFPLKSGDTTKKLTWCAWIKQESQPGSYAYLLSKYDATNNKRSLGLLIWSNVLQFYCGYSAGTVGELLSTGIAIADGEWYHVAVVVDGVAKTINVRVYKLSTTTVYTYSGAMSYELYVSDAAFRIGARDGDTGYHWDGKIDEVVIFNDLLTATEIDKIRAGTFGTYIGEVPLTFTPQAETYGPHTYVGQIPLTFTPQAICGGPHTPYVGSQLLRFTPVADYEPVGAGTSTAIPASTGGWAMGGAGVWASSTPTDTEIPAPAEPTGFYLGGGAAAGEAEVISTIPGVEAIVTEGAPFIFCGPGATGDAATIFPASETILAEAGFKFGGAGVWGQVSPEDLPSAVLVPTGGYVLSGTGFSLDPDVTPATTVIVPTGGWKLGGRRPDPIEVTYPDSVDRVIISSGGWEFCGHEGVWEESTPTATVIESAGLLFLMGGAGLATSKFPPIAVITGDGLGGFVLGGAEVAEIYEAWVLGGQSFEPSCYSGFNFNSFAQHRGQSFAAGAAGIYLLDGIDTDAGETIHSGIRIGPINAGADRDKRLRGIQFGDGGPDTRVRVSSEEGKGVFATDRDDNRVVISRDIQGRNFTIDLMDFKEISQLEMTFLRLARR